MAVAYVQRRSATSVTGTSVSPTPYTPGANKLTLGVCSNVASGSPNVPTISGWTLIGSGTTFGINNPADTLISFFFKDATGALESPVIDFAGQTQVDGFAVSEEWTGAALGSLAFPQTVKTANGGPVTSGSTTLSALKDSGSMAYGMFVTGINQTITVGTGYAATSQFAGATGPFHFMPEYKLNATLVDASWASSDLFGVSAIEIATSGLASWPFKPLPILKGP